MQSKDGVSNPAITKAIVDDIDMSAASSFVADPLVVKDGDTYYVFFEAYDGTNVYTVYATSSDCLTWTYGSKITIDGVDMSTSYPYVFKVDGVWWMISRQDLDQEIQIFQADSFPTNWKTGPAIYSQTSLKYRDRTIFQWNGTFYIIAFDHTAKNCHLYYSPSLYGRWREHPSSPILTTDNNSRPAGRPIIRDGVGVDILVQDGTPTYGNGVRIYRLTNLSTTTVTATELATSPLLQYSGAGWNANGMHTLDRIDATISVVDGIQGVVWSIGIYEDTP